MSLGASRDDVNTDLSADMQLIFDHLMVPRNSEVRLDGQMKPEESDEVDESGGLLAQDAAKIRCFEHVSASVRPGGWCRKQVRS